MPFNPNFFLVSRDELSPNTTVDRFTPKYFEAVGDFKVACSVVTLSSTSAKFTGVYRSNLDLPGLYLWRSEDLRSHAYLAYNEVLDWSGTTLSMRLQYDGMRNPEAMFGKTALVVVYSDDSQDFVYLDNYITDGSGDDITVTLIFDPDDAGRIRPGLTPSGEIDFADIAAVYLNCAPVEYNYGQCSVANNYTTTVVTPYTESSSSWAEVGGTGQWSSFGSYVRSNLRSLGNSGPTNTLRFSAYGFALPGTAVPDGTGTLRLHVQARDDGGIGPYGGTLVDYLVAPQLSGVQGSNVANGQTVTSPGVGGGVTSATWEYDFSGLAYSVANINNSVFGVDVQIEYDSGNGAYFGLQFDSEFTINASVPNKFIDIETGNGLQPKAGDLLALEDPPSTIVSVSDLGGGVFRLELPAPLVFNHNVGEPCYITTTEYQAFPDEITASLTVSDIEVTGPGKEIPARAYAAPQHSFGVADDYSFRKIQTPERLVDHLASLGFSGAYTLYWSTTGFESLEWKTTDPIPDRFGYPEGRWEVKASDPTFNGACREWLGDCVSRVNSAGLRFVLSQSLETLMHFTPEQWPQLDTDGERGSTGYGNVASPLTDPWTNFIDPCNEDAKAWLIGMAEDFKSICDDQDVTARVQLGEPNLWNGSGPGANQAFWTLKPCFYGTSMAAKFLSEHGTALPVYTSNNPTLDLTPGSADYVALYWLQDQLSQFLQDVAQGYEDAGIEERIVLCFPDFFLSAYDSGGMYQIVNRAREGLLPAHWDTLQLELYGSDQTGNIPVQSEGWGIIVGDFGWPQNRLEYFAGFAAPPSSISGSPSLETQWDRYVNSAEDAKDIKRVKQTYFWALPQVCGVINGDVGYDSFVYQSLAKGLREFRWDKPHSQADAKAAATCAKSGFVAPAHSIVRVGGIPYIERFAPRIEPRKNAEWLD